MKHQAICLTALLAAAMIGGCASTGEKPAAAAMIAEQKPLPRDPAIDAYVGAMRADLSHGNVQIINDVMHLSNDEAKVFWPIYEDYESEMFDIGDQRIDIIRRFAAAQKAGKIEQADAADIADKYFKFEQDKLDLVKKYHGIISAKLSPVRAGQFTQIEHRVDTIIDLMIASGMPLVNVAGN